MTKIFFLVPIYFAPQGFEAGEGAGIAMNFLTSFNDLPWNHFYGRLGMIRIPYVGCVSASALAEDIPLILEPLERGLHR